VLAVFASFTGLALPSGERGLFCGVLEMVKKLYVGNLGYGVTDGELSKMFEPHGTVESAQVVMDRETGRSKGFGFVEMKTEQEAQAAIAALDGKDAGGRNLKVNEAKPRAEGGGGKGRPGGGGGGYSRGRF
jgi:RNA recognition motif-containing protein